MPNCSRIGLVTLSSNAIGNCVGLNGSSCGDDSQVPGIDISCTSGQLASWNSGRGFPVVGGTAVGGTAVGGTAVCDLSGWRIMIHTTATTSATTSAIAPAAISARIRWRLRRLLVAILRPSASRVVR